MCPKGVIKRSVEGEGADAVASAHGERPGSTHKVAEVQCSRNTTPDPWQPHACIGLTAMAARALRAGLALRSAPYPMPRRLASTTRRPYSETHGITFKS